MARSQDSQRVTSARQSLQASTKEPTVTQEQIGQLVAEGKGYTYHLKAGGTTRSIQRLYWAAWRDILSREKISLVNAYSQWLFGTRSPFYLAKATNGRKAVLCAGLIDRKLSVLRPKGFPSHYSNAAVNAHLNATNYRHKLIDIGRADIAHHLFDPDTALYYVSNSSKAASCALLAFDIDAKPDPDTRERPKDAQEQAAAIRDLLAWDGYCFIQPSTSGHGAYLYFVLQYSSISAQTVNDVVKKFCRQVVSKLTGQFESHVDAIKGDIPVISSSSCPGPWQCNTRLDIGAPWPYKTIISQGNLVRLPVVSCVQELDILISMQCVSFKFLEEYVSDFVSDIGCASASCSGEKKPAHLSSPLPLLSTRGTSGRKAVGMRDIGSPVPFHVKPMKRVIAALKSFRDTNHRDPVDFLEFNSYYEQLCLNTGSAKPQRRQRYNLALSRLGEYRASSGTGFDENAYGWVEKWITEEHLKAFSRRRKQKLVMGELKVAQYVIGLATAYPQPGDNDYGCPVSRMAAVHEKLHKEGKLSQPYGKGGRKRYGCYVALLLRAGLVEVIRQEVFLAHRARKLIVTARDEVFGERNAERIRQARRIRDGVDPKQELTCETCQV